MSHIINIDELEYAGFPGGLTEQVQEKFGGNIGQIGQTLGTQKIGANITVCPLMDSDF